MPRPAPPRSRGRGLAAAVLGLVLAVAASTAAAPAARATPLGGDDAGADAEDGGAGVGVSVDFNTYTMPDASAGVHAGFEAQLASAARRKGKKKRPTAGPTQSPIAPTTPTAAPTFQTFPTGSSVTISALKTYGPSATAIIKNGACSLVFNATGALQLKSDTKVLWSTPSFSNKASLTYDTKGNLAITLGGLVQWERKGSGVDAARRLTIAPPSDYCLTVSSMLSNVVDWSLTQVATPALTSSDANPSLSAPYAMVNGSCLAYFAGGSLVTRVYGNAPSWISPALGTTTSIELDFISGGLYFTNATGAVIWSPSGSNPYAGTPTTLALNAETCSLALTVPNPRKKGQKGDPGYSTIFAGVDAVLGSPVDYSSPKSKVLPLFWGTTWPTKAATIASVVSFTKALSDSAYFKALKQYTRNVEPKLNVSSAVVVPAKWPSLAKAKTPSQKVNLLYRDFLKYVCKTYAAEISAGELNVVNVYLDQALPSIGGTFSQCFFNYGTNRCSKDSPLISMNVFGDYTDTCRRSASVILPGFTANALGLGLVAPWVAGKVQGWVNPVTGEDVFRMANAVWPYKVGSTVALLASFWDNALATAYLG